MLRHRSIGVVSFLSSSATKIHHTRIIPQHRRLSAIPSYPFPHHGQHQHQHQHQHRLHSILHDQPPHSTSSNVLVSSPYSRYIPLNFSKQYASYSSYSTSTSSTSSTSSSNLTTHDHNTDSHPNPHFTEAWAYIESGEYAPALNTVRQGRWDRQCVELEAALLSQGGRAVEGAGLLETLAGRMREEEGEEVEQVLLTAGDMWDMAGDLDQAAKAYERVAEMVERRKEHEEGENKSSFAQQEHKQEQEQEREQQQPIQPTNNLSSPRRRYNHQYQQYSNYSNQLNGSPDYYETHYSLSNHEQNNHNEDFNNNSSSRNDTNIDHIDTISTNHSKNARDKNTNHNISNSNIAADPDRRPSSFGSSTDEENESFNDRGEDNNISNNYEHYHDYYDHQHHNSHSKSLNHNSKVDHDTDRKNASDSNHVDEAEAEHYRSLDSTPSSNACEDSPITPRYQENSYNGHNFDHNETEENGPNTKPNIFKPQLQLDSIKRISPSASSSPRSLSPSPMARRLQERRSLAGFDADYVNGDVESESGTSQDPLLMLNKMINVAEDIGKRLNTCQGTCKVLMNTISTR
eukprot:gb/GECH01002903.1/.p1 GENE.gb/GECH01002903.1/~~gb/GECH01002903.1/.p1  ORF type:complete len:574 (+),score=125.70 gb/GECH01002903.1/:1-1722(+)